MNKYLLLRDNKQSGPYSVDELAAHGLKAYDLVWLEGKSAAWRYPSEIEELKPFAPVVEEQPFDRFYKKSEPKTIEPAIKDNTRVQQNHFAHSEIKKSEQTVFPKQYVEISNGSKKIHVSLPVTKSTDSSNKSTKEESRAEAPRVISSVETGKPFSQSVLMNEPVSYDDSRKDQYADSQTAFGKNYKKSKQEGPVTNSSSIQEAPVSKLLFRSVAAVCLLLGGALIGLIINYNSQQKKFQQLNQLVQQIKEKDNPGTSKNVKNDHLTEEATMPISAQQELTQPSEQPVYKEDIQLPVAKKDRRDTKSMKKSTDTLSQSQTPEVVPAVQSEEPAKIDKVAADLARRNLWQLVSVDHNNYKTGVFGGVSNLSLSLSNKSLLQLQQVEVEVLFLSPENKTVNKQKIVFENVAPGEQLKINVPKSNRGVKVEHSIKKITTKEFELAHAGM